MAKERDLDEIIENKWIVEFDRKPFDNSKELGFVLAWNNYFTLIHILDKDWYQLDGYCIFQNKSVKKFWVYDKDEYFFNEVVKLKKLEPKPVPQVSIESWEVILQTVNDNFNLVGIESELIHKDELKIGKLKKIGKKSFSLLEIKTDATWFECASKIELKLLTKVCFDSSYNKTLWNVSESRKKK